MIVGGIIPPEDARILVERGVARVYTPKDYQINDMVNDIVTVVREANGLP